MGTVLLGRQGYRRHKLGISLLVVYIISHFCLDVGKGDCCCWNRRNPRCVIWKGDRSWGITKNMSRYHSCGGRPPKTLSLPQAVLLPASQVEHACHGHRQRGAGELHLSRLWVLSPSWNCSPNLHPLERVQHCQSQRPCIHKKWRQGGIFLICLFYSRWCKFQWWLRATLATLEWLHEILPSFPTWETSSQRRSWRNSSSTALRFS